MTAINDIGFTELVHDSAPPGSKCVNIVFVHGLKGHPKKTWSANPEIDSSAQEQSPAKNRRSLKSLFRQKPTSRDVESVYSQTNPTSSKVFWLSDYLVDDIPEARIWTYGYNADVTGGLFESNNKNSISQHGRDLAVRLERDIENKDPIFFVAHSLGGILVKDAIRRSEACRLRTRLVVFLGTPHRGSEYSGWGQVISNLLGVVRHDTNSKIVAALDVNSEVLDNIHEEFKTLVHTENIKIHSFQEARGLSGVKGLEKKVIDDSSSKMDLPRALEIVETIDADHRQMVKCSSRTDARYLAILRVLRQHLRDAKSVRLPIREAAERHEALMTREAHGVPTKIAASPELAAKFLVPYNRNNEFVGRSDLLANIEQQLGLISGEKYGRIRSRVAIYGLGGVGKTQTALAYAYRVREARNVAVFWVAASNAERFVQSYSSIAKDCGIPNHDNPLINVKAMMKEWLENTERGRWFLIIDNADNPELFDSTSEDDLSRYIPECNHGSVLITSRNKQTALKLAQGKGVIEVGKLGEDEADQLIRALLEDNHISRDDTSLLSSRLEYLPLALVQALSFIQENTISVSAYIELLDSDLGLVERLSEPFETVGRDSETPHALTATWVISFEQIRRQHAFASDILSLMCLLDRQAIPMEFLTNYTAKKRPDESMESDKVEVIKALGTLKAFSFISEGKDRTLDMHRLVQLVARKWLLDHGRMREVAEQAIDTVLEVFGRDDNLLSKDKFVLGGCNKYLPHAYALLNHDSLSSQAGKSVASLHHILGAYFYSQGHYIDAERHALRAIALRDELIGEDAPFNLTGKANLALVYDKLSRFEEAEKLSRRVLEAKTRLFGEEDDETLETMNTLAICLGNNGQLDEAEALHKRVSETRKRVLGEEHPDTLLSLGNMVSIFKAQNRLKEAVELSERVLEAEIRVRGEDHPYTLNTANNLTIALRADGRTAEADELLGKTLEVTKRVMGDEHPQTMMLMCNMAEALRDKQPEHAEELFQQTIQGRKKVLGEDHPGTLSAMWRLASMRYRRDTEVGLAMLEECGERAKRALGQHHKDTIFYKEQLEYIQQPD